MTSRLDEIKARHELANSQPITDLRVWDSVFDVPRLVAALESVLELHQRNRYDECIECLSTDEYGEATNVDYPCPTVVAIQAALGEGEQ